MRPELLLQDTEPVSFTFSSVLIVDDSVEDSLAIARLLRQSRGTSVRILTASNMLDALREFRHERPDCVVLDHRLGDGEGIELLHMLSEITAPLPAPVIYLASNDSPRLAVRVLKLGALDYLAKSWLDEDSLIGAIERAVEKVSLAKMRYHRQRATEDKNRDLQKSVQALQESERAKEQVTGLAPTFLYVHDLLEDRNVYSNQTMLNTLGYTRDEIIEMGRGGIRSLVHPEDLANYDAQAARMAVLGDREVSECEYRLKHSSGEWLWLRFREIVFLRDKHDTVWQIIGTAEDVTERRVVIELLERKASNLQEQLKNVSKVWDQGVVGIALTLDDDPREVQINLTLSRLLDLPERTDIASFARVLGFPSSSSPLARALKQGLETRNAERIVHQEHGLPIRLLETTQAVRDPSGDITGSVAYFVPVAEDDYNHSSQAARDDLWHLRLRQLQAKLELAEARKREAEEQLQLSEQISSQRHELLQKSEEQALKLREEMDASLGSSYQTGAELELATGRAREAEEKLRASEAKWRSALEQVEEGEENKKALSIEVDKLQRDYLESELQLRARAAELQEKTLENEVAQAQVREKQEELVLAEQQLASANLRASEAEKEAEIQQSLLGQLQVRIEELTKELLENRETLERARQVEAELQAARTNLEESEAQRVAAANSLIKLEDRLKQLIETQETSETYLQDHENLVATLQLQIDHTSGKLKHAEDEAARSIAELKPLQSEVARLRKEVVGGIEALQLSDTALLQAREELASSRRAAIQHHSELAKREADFAAVEAKTLQTLQRNSELEEKLSVAVKERDAVAREAESQKADLSKTQEEAQNLQERLNASEDQVRVLSARLQPLVLQIAELGTEATAREMELAALRVRLVELEKIEADLGQEAADKALELIRKEEELDSMRESLQKLEANLKEADQYGLSVATQLNEGEDLLKKAEIDLKEKESLIHQLRQKLSDRDEQLAELRAKIAQQQEARERWELRCVDLQRQLALAQETLTRWQADAPESAKRLEEVSLELRELKAASKAAGRERDALTRELSLSIKEQQGLTLSLKDRTDEVDALRRTGIELKRDLQQSRKGAEEAHARLEAVGSELTLVRGELELATRALQSSNISRASLEAQLAQRSVDLELATADLSRLNLLLDRSEKDRIAAQDKLVLSEDKLRHALHDLRNSEEKYRSLATTVPCVIFSTNSLGQINYVNEQWDRFTGIGMAVAQEQGWKKVVHKDDLDAFASTWNSAIKDGQGFSIQFRLKRKDDSYRWHEMHHTPEFENGRILQWFGTINEIHEQVISREAARQARLRYGALLDNTSEAVLFLSPTGNVLGASKSSLNLLRQGSAGVVGQPLWETKWWPKVEKNKLQDGVRRAAGGEIVELNSFRVDIDGQPRPVIINILPVKDENEQVAMLVPYFRDV